jgi:hypothetical protein
LAISSQSHSTATSRTRPSSQQQRTVLLDYSVSTSTVAHSIVPSYNSSARIPRKTPSCQEYMFTVPIPSNGRPIVGRVASWGCLLTRCLAMDVLLLHAYVSRECDYRVAAYQKVCMSPYYIKSIQDNTPGTFNSYWIEFDILIAVFMKISSWI